MSRNLFHNSKFKRARRGSRFSDIAPSTQHSAPRYSLKTRLSRLETLEFVYSRLTGFLQAETAEKWLLGTNAHLGNRRPIDLIREGRIAEVIAAVEQYELGSYS